MLVAVADNAAAFGGVETATQSFSRHSSNLKRHTLLTGQEVVPSMLLKPISTKCPEIRHSVFGFLLHESEEDRVNRRWHLHNGRDTRASDEPPRRRPRPKTLREDHVRQWPSATSFPGLYPVRSWPLSPQLARFHEALSSVEGRTPSQYLEKKHLDSIIQTSVMSEPAED